MATLTAAPPIETAKDDRRLKTRTLVLTSLGYFIVILDTTAKNVALPKIGADLHAGIGGLQWVVDSYLLVFASFLLTAGALSDRLGARRVFGVGLAVFGAASALSALAGSSTQLTICQAVAGLGAALVTPATLALLAGTYTDVKERGKALGVWAAVAGVGTAIGPLIGGGLVNVAGWQSIFLINIPIAVGGIVFAYRWLPEVARNRNRTLDIAGQVSAIATLAALSYAIISAGEHGWSSTRTTIGFAVAVFSLAVFLTAESRSSAPMVPLAFFRERRFSSAVFAGMTINFGTIGQLFLLTLYFQNLHGFSPLLTGVAMLPTTVACVVVPAFAGRAVARIGPRVPLALGLLIAGAGALSLTVLGATTPYLLGVPGLLLVGIGSSIAIPAVAAAAMTGVAPTQVGIASGILNTSRQTGALLGVALLGSVVNAGSFSSRLPVAFAITAAVQVTGALVSFVAARTRRGKVAR